MKLLIAILAILCIAWAPEDSESTVTWDEFWEWQGQYVTSHKTARRCWQYEPLVDRWNPDFGLPTNIVLAVMAQESACMQYSEGGLMQVTPRPGYFTKEELSDPAISVYAGMSILADALEQSGDMRTALAAYNCGWDSLRLDLCMPGGGYEYADRVLEYWLPLIMERAP